VEFKRTLSTRGTLGLAAAAGLAGALAFGSPAQAETVTIPINPGNVPTTAEGFEDNSCDNLPDDLPGDADGWVFVLPAAAGAEGNFISVTATFTDANGTEQTYTTGENGGIVDGSGDNKAYIVTPAGWTLVDAEADVTDPKDGAKFNLTHACPGTPGDNPTSPGENPSSPGEEPSSSGEQPSTPGESGSVPGEESTSPAGASLPTTGAPLTVAIVSAAALAAAGAALFMVRRRRAAQDW
jgi:LPXTG-motif cell wall-anchored protein